MKSSCWVVAAVLAVGCSKDGGTPTAEGTSAKTTDDTKADQPAISPARQAVVDAWSKAGLTTSALASTKGFGKDCSAGTVDKLEVVICEYASADEAKQAEQPGLAWVGGTTGAAWASGSLVIAVADRKKADPHGKTINQLMKSSPK